MKKHLKQSSGFTLVEVLAVIVILSILAGGYWMFSSGARQQGLQVRVEADMEALASAKLRWRLDHPGGAFPATDAERYQALRPYLDPERPATWEQFAPAGYQYQINELLVAPSYIKTEP